MLRSLLSAVLIFRSLVLHAEPLSHSINALGCSLLQALPERSGNQLLSPYSVHSALSMTAAGAQGKTRSEMLTVLGGTEETLHPDHEKLRADLEEIETRCARISTDSGQNQEPGPTLLRVANRLFAEKTYSFLPEFLALTEARYRAPLEALSFQGDPEAARKVINAWVEKQTLSKIQDLLGPSDITTDTSLILVNALYFRAPWQEPFQEAATGLEPFHLAGGTVEKVPTMVTTKSMGYQKFPGVNRVPFEAVSIPYVSGMLQFLVLIPEGSSSIPALESQLSAAVLESCARLPRRPVTLHLPKLHLAPPTLSLSEALKSLGMSSAFDAPPLSADFGRMHMPSEKRLIVGNVLHKTFLDLDEKGTEAAAATAVTMMKATSILGRQEEPVLVRVDRPFLFAIQHVGSGTCLFLGRVQNPK
jgi:serpin B